MNHMDQCRVCLNFMLVDDLVSCERCASAEDYAHPYSRMYPICQTCAYDCTSCQAIYCVDCIIHKHTMTCENCGDMACEEYLRNKKSDSETFKYKDSYFCDKCLDNWDRWYPNYIQLEKRIPNEYMINPERNIKKMRLSRHERFYYECVEQGPTSLVYGVINLVFSFISDRDKLLNLSLVCKQYRNVLMSDSDIWMKGTVDTVIQDNMLFIYNIPRQRISFPIQCVGMSLKILNYLYEKRESYINASEYWPKTIDSFRCAYNCIAMYSLFGKDWKWKLGYTFTLTSAQHFQNLSNVEDFMMEPERLYDVIQDAMECIAIRWQNFRLLTRQDLSAHME